MGRLKMVGTRVGTARLGVRSVAAPEVRQTAAQRGYGYRWQKARAAFLAEHPLCKSCMETGRVEPATVVDHVIAHRGDQGLFWDRSNWQPMCKTCHDRKTEAEECGGPTYSTAIGPDGLPTDPRHPFNRGR